MVTLKDYLIRINDHFNNDKRWTKRAVARNFLNLQCNPTSMTATKWCILGAMYYLEIPVKDIHKVSKHLLSCSPYDPHFITDNNDHPSMTFEDLKAWLQKAIAKV